MIAKIFINRTKDEIFKGIGEYFFGEITGKYIKKIEKTYHINGRKSTKIVEKTIYKITPLESLNGHKIKKYIDFDFVDLNTKLTDKQIKQRRIDKLNYVRDGVLDSL